MLLTIHSSLTELYFRSEIWVPSPAKCFAIRFSLGSAYSINERIYKWLILPKNEHQLFNCGFRLCYVTDITLFDG